MKIAKILILVTLISGLSTAYADLGRGPYIGIGGDQFWTEYDHTVYNNVTGRKISHSPSTSNFLGHPFLGYGHTFYYDLAYLGAEVGTYFPTISMNVTRLGAAVTSQHFHNQLKLQNYF